MYKAVVYVEAVRPYVTRLPRHQGVASHEFQVLFKTTTHLRLSLYHNSLSKDITIILLRRSLENYHLSTINYKSALNHGCRICRLLGPDNHPT